MINKDDNQHLIGNSEETQLILKALNTNWRIKIDFSMHEEMLKYIHRDIFYYSPKYVWPNMEHLIYYFAHGLFADFDDINSPNQPKPIKDLFCMTCISTLYTKWLINDFSQTLLEKKDGVTYDLKYESRNGTFDRRASADLWRNLFYAMDKMDRQLPGHCPEHILGIKYSSSTPFLSNVFNHLIQIKQSFSLFLEIFDRIMSQMELSLFDYKTYNLLNDSIIEEKYDLFREIIYGWNNEVIPKLAIILEHFYPIFLFLETNIQKKDQNILDDIRCFLTEHTSVNFPLIHSPIIIEASLTSYILITIINYLLFNILREYLNPDVSECLHYFWPKNQLTGFHLDYIVWINENMTKQIYYFQNTAKINLLSDFIDTESQTIRNQERNKENKSIKDTKQTQSAYRSGREQDSGIMNQETEKSSQLNMKKDIPNHIEVPYSKEMLTKFAEGLVRGIDDDSKPLVTSKVKEGNGTKIKKLVCLFSGVDINDESLEWPYNLKWTDYANSLKLLVYLLHYKGELKDPLDAINEKDKEGIAEVIKQNFKGIHVWSIVGPALNYKERSLSSKAKIPVKSNVDLMKKLAQFWFECKKLDD